MVISPPHVLYAPGWTPVAPPPAFARMDYLPNFLQIIEGTFDSSRLARVSLLDNITGYLYSSENWAPIAYFG